MEKKQIHELPPSKRFKLLQSTKTTDEQNPKSLPAKKGTIHEENSKFLPAKKRIIREDKKPIIAKKTTRDENPESVIVKKHATHEENTKSILAKKGAELLYSSCTSMCLPHKKRVWAPFSFHIEEEEETETKPLKEVEPKDKQEEERQTKTANEIERNGPEEETKLVKEIESEIKEEEEEEETKPLKEITEEDVEEEEIDDGIICAVCQSTDGDPSDPIVFCDGCDLMVHPTCYGNPLSKAIPEGDWFCSVCESKCPKKAKSCVLCPKKGGALKPTTDNKWAHIMCAFLVPEVFFRDSEGRDGIDCSKIPKKRWGKSCYICKESEGCVIFCAESRCELGFHVSCGLDEGHSIEYREGKGGDIVAGFCGDHTKLWEKQQLTGKFKIVSRDKELKLKART